MIQIRTLTRPDAGLAAGRSTAEEAEGSAASPQGVPDFDDAPEPRPDPGRTVLGNLVLFALALSLPMLLFAAFLLTRFATTERTRLEAEATNLAHTIAALIDRDLSGILAAVDVLSTSPFLQSGDLAAFRRQAGELMERQGLVTVLAELDGQQLVNLRLPESAPLPKVEPAWTEEQLRGPAFVTDLVPAHASGRGQFLAVTAVRRVGARPYVLYFTLPLDRLELLLRQAEVPRGYTASIIDRRDVIMARSMRAGEFVGKEASEDLRRATAGPRGTWSGTTVDGTPVFGAWRRSYLADFRAAVGIRHADLNAPVWRSVATFATIGIALAVLSVLAGFYFANRIARPIVALAREAAKLGRGQPIAPLATRLREADLVSEELAKSSLIQREREADLREATNEMQRFAYIVSHDLRSPLVNIMGFTTELEALRDDMFQRIDELRARTEAPDSARDEQLSRDFDEAIGFIKASIAKMDRLINAILRLSREGRREFNPGRVNMEELVRGIKASLATQAEAADAEVIVGPLPALISDQLALEQIFSNLIDNALKYLKKGVAGRVEVTGRVEGRMAVYEVRDNGRGIDPQDSERVFDLFRRSGAQDRPGEGIGLAHVRTLVRRLGGSISLTSELGTGSTFTVTLPRRWAGERQRKAA